jgi:hypothetical protein
MSDQNVPLARARIGDRLARADGDDLQPPLRILALELGDDHLLQQAGVAYARGALDDQILRGLRARGSGDPEPGDNNQSRRNRAPRSPHALPSILSAASLCSRPY